MTFMRMFFSPVAIGARTAALATLLAASAVPAFAQDQPAAAPAPAPAAPAAAPQAAAAPSVPQPDWEKVCGAINNAQECHTSRKRLAATGQPVAQFLVIERGDKKLLQLAVPPVALIQPGVQVKIDNGEATGVKYVVCTPGECLALGEINPDFIAKLKKGGNVTITMLNPQGKPVNFEISLGGFTAMYEGPGINPEEAQARQAKLEDELKKKADEARQQLLKLQQQQSAGTTQ
jgi:invasion protein IalB